MRLPRPSSEGEDLPRALLNLLNNGPVLPRRVVVARIKLAGGGQVRGRLWKLPGMERRAGHTDVGARVVRADDTACNAGTAPARRADST